MLRIREKSFVNELTTEIIEENESNEQTLSYLGKSKSILKQFRSSFQSHLEKERERENVYDRKIASLCFDDMTSLFLIV